MANCGKLFYCTLQCSFVPYIHIKKPPAFYNCWFNFLFLITLCWHFTPLVADTGGDERSGTPTAAKNYTFFSFLTHPTAAKLGVYYLGLVRKKKVFRTGSFLGATKIKEVESFTKRYISPPALI
jgi:hypothetical protein